MNSTRVILIGGGLAGLMAAIRVAELGHSVDLFSVVPVRRSHSVCAQGGINAAKNLKGEGDSTWQHFDDTVYGGDGNDTIDNSAKITATSSAAADAGNVTQRDGDVG